MEFRLVVKSNRFGQMPAAMRRAVGKGLAQAAPVLLADMQRRTPVDTGELRASESAESTDTSLTLRAGGGLPDIRAVAVHQGTSRMQGRPFMRDAIEAGVPAIVEAIESAVGSELR